MDQKQTSSNSGGGGGFLLGVLIGILIALLFTTKKGRKILKTLTEEGMDKIANLEDLFEKKLHEEKSDDTGIGDFETKKTFQQVVSPEEHIAQDHTHQTESHVYTHHYPKPTQEPAHTDSVTPQVHESAPQQHEQISSQIEEFVQQLEHQDDSVLLRPVSTGRRFFRGIPKRVSN